MADADASRPADAAGVARWLRDAGVSVVALPFVDPSAIVRVKTIPVDRFPQVAEHGVGLSTLFN
ncbi:MAG TPA: glutamine synthetase, partial [Actinomycetota bacterium]|nr:glutamine synthetase [Actinomycetota bacterium]